MGTEIEHCERCGSLVYPFSKETSVSDGSSYCVKCAEELDRGYLAKNTCSMCTRLLDRGEVKFVMPSRMYSSYFFDRLPITHRLMCVKCYRRASRLDIIRQPLAKIWQIRARLGKSITQKQAMKTRELRN
jgi:hypothetical protein